MLCLYISLTINYVFVTVIIYTTGVCNLYTSFTFLCPDIIWLFRLICFWGHNRASPVVIAPVLIVWQTLIS